MSLQDAIDLFRGYSTLQFSSSIPQASVASAKCSPYAVRFLIQNISNLSKVLLDTRVTSFATELSKAISVDFDVYSVLGVTVLPLAADDTIDGNEVGSGAVLVDVVFLMRDWNTYYPSKDKMALAATDYLSSDKKITNVQVTVLDYASFRCPVNGSPLDSGEFYGNWNAQTPLFQSSKGTLNVIVPTDEWNDIVLHSLGGRSSYAFGWGISTDPVSLKPILVDGKVQPFDGMPGVTPGPKPGLPDLPKVVAGASVGSIAVFAIMGFIGYKLVQLWKD